MSDISQRFKVTFLTFRSRGCVTLLAKVSLRLRGPWYVVSDSRKPELSGNRRKHDNANARLSNQPGHQADLLAELRATVDEQVVATHSWYQQHAKIPRLLYRTSGTLVILLSISLPFLASLDYAAKAVLLSAIALIIAALTGLNSFFAWEQTWRSRRQTEFALAHLLAQWEVKLAAANCVKDQAEKQSKYIEATEQLLVESRTIVASETEEFFSAAKWPQAKAK